MEQTASAIEQITDSYHPFEAVGDPYPVFTALREVAPAFYAGEIDHWVVTRYADIKRILLDTETYSAANTITPIHPVGEAAARVLREGGWRLTPALGNNDPPDHSRFRRNVHRAFTPRRVALLESFVRDTVSSAIDAMMARGRGRGDLMSEVIFDLPALTILRLVGVPESDAAIIKRGSRYRILFIWGRPTPEQQLELAESMVSFWHHLRALVDERLLQSRDDLTSDLLAVRDGDDSVLSLDEVTSVLFAFFTAGHETTAGLIGNAVHQLLRHAQAWAKLCANRERIPLAVEEVLRYDSSVVSWRRRARREVNVGGVVIPAGAQVLLLLGSANHDERVFEDPERFDIARENATAHLSFGHGIHHCLGASLARMEARVALEQLTARLPSLRAAHAGTVDVLPNTTFRGPRRLDVTWAA